MCTLIEIHDGRGVSNGNVKKVGLPDSWEMGRANCECRRWTPFDPSGVKK